MNLKITLAFAFFACSSANIFAQNWLWLDTIGASGWNMDVARSVSTDASGNVFATGSFSSPTITFGSITLINSSPTNMFLVKYDANGNVLWAKSAVGKGSGVSSTVDKNGNVFVTGNFSSPTISFGSTTLNNSLGFDLFIVKYDSGGNVIWAKSVPAGSCINFSMSTDTGGNIFLTGSFFFSTTFGSTTLVGAGSNDVFIAKLDMNGNALWAKRGIGATNDEGFSVSADLAGNAHVTGYFRSPTIKFDSITVYNTDTTGNLPDVFIVKYDSTGNVLWAKSASGVSYAIGNSVNTDKAGNAFLTGYFQNPSITFGPITLTNSGSLNNPSVFVVKYDGSGNVIWAKNATGTGASVGYSASTNATGNIFVAGKFGSPTLTFGSTTITKPPPSSYVAPMFVVKYDSNGNVICASTLESGGNNLEQGSRVSADPFGNAYIGGGFLINLGIINDTNRYRQDVFVAKFRCNDNDGVTELNNEDGAFIFPNPFSTHTTLQTAKPLINASLTVYNSVGQTVKRMDNLAGQTVLFHRDNLPSGLYFVRLTQDGNTISADKFIIVDK